jgi:phosphohistidine phosphatase SixA
MKRPILALFLLACFCLCGCDSCEVVRVKSGKLHFSDGKSTGIPHWNEEGWTHFFFVRHADRLPEPADGLSPEGIARAERLGEIMKEAGLDQVFTTNTVRTRTTAESVRMHYSNLPSSIPTYPSEDLAETEWLQTQLSLHRGQRIFVVGHSNTVPRMVNKLVGPSSTLTDLDAKNYSAFFVVASRGLGDSEYLWRHY